VLNDNSSRFGKLLESWLTLTAMLPIGDDDGGLVVYAVHPVTRAAKPIGAKISKYLLEKSRVTSRATNEQSFHVLTYVLEGMSAERREDLGMDASSSYAYLPESVNPITRLFCTILTTTR
jgi:myosin heavy subunit